MKRQFRLPTMSRGVIHRLRDGSREVLIVRLAGEPYMDRWCFPGGMVEEGEQPEVALRDWLGKRLGLKVEILYGQPPFDAPWDEAMTRWRFFFCEYVVQDEVSDSYYAEQRWVLEGSLREYEFDPVSQQVVDWMLEKPQAEEGGD